MSYLLRCVGFWGSARPNLASQLCVCIWLNVLMIIIIIHSDDESCDWLWMFMIFYDFLWLSMIFWECIYGVVGSWRSRSMRLGLGIYIYIYIYMRMYLYVWFFVTHPWFFVIDCDLLWLYVIVVIDCVWIFVIDCDFLWFFGVYIEWW